ncbi:hypothetical protein [Mycolicibacterium pulveris]|uniref:hypothetical protein n=1 Tax=Mycolicibacterium pulveris TaxID=36813 RepID=UPI003CE7EE98
MFENLSDYWWILALLAYCVLLVVLIRRGTWVRHGPKIILAVNCAIILSIPFMDRPYSFVAAVVIVLSLLILFRSSSTAEATSGPARR